MIIPSVGQAVVKETHGPQQMGMEVSIHFQKGI